MNKKLTLLASLLALLVSAGVALAGDLSDATLNKLMDLSGTNRQVAMIPQAVQGGFNAGIQGTQESDQKLPLSKQDIKELKAAIADAFQVDPLLQATAAAIRKNVSEADAKQVLAWLESDVGRKITQAEVDATNDQASGNVMNDARALMADKERVEIARQMDKLLHATDEQIELMVQMETTMAVVVSKRMNPDQAVDEAAIRKRAAAGINRANIEQAVVLDFVYAYRNIDIPSLKKYVDVMGQPPMRHFNDSLKDGMMDGLNKCVTKAADNIAAIAKKKKRI